MRASFATKSPLGGLVIGIDFGGPATASAQRRKILAIVARKVGPRSYAVDVRGLNKRVLDSPHGWTAEELADALVCIPEPVSAVAADFPFSLPASLLRSASFARLAGHPRAFGSWERFNSFVEARLPLECPVDYEPFARWRSKKYWLKRETDKAAGAHPALKDKFQVLFNMTLLGNAFLARLRRSGLYAVIPFSNAALTPVIEVYPGHAMRSLNVPKYKSAPRKAIDALLGHLQSAAIQMTIAPEIRRLCESYDSGSGANSDFDAADALVAAGLGVMYAEQSARELFLVPTERGTEGAIWSV